MTYEYTKVEFEFGITGHVLSDPEPMNPRVEYDNVTTMACSHCNYNLGDKDAHDPLTMDFVYRLMSDAGLDDICEHCEGTSYGPDWESCEHCDGNGNGTISLEDAWKQVKEHYYIQPLYLYDHGGISISSSRFSCPWDSGQVGFQYVLKSKAHKEWGPVEYEWVDNVRKPVRDRTEADYYELMDSEVKCYDDYLTGNVWGYEIKDKDGNILESCWGYVGDPEYCEEEMRGVAKALEARMLLLKAAEEGRAEQEAQERLYWAQRDVVTVVA